MLAMTTIVPRSESVPNLEVHEQERPPPRRNSSMLNFRRGDREEVRRPSSWPASAPSALPSDGSQRLPPQEEMLLIAIAQSALEAPTLGAEESAGADVSDDESEASSSSSRAAVEKAHTHGKEVPTRDEFFVEETPSFSDIFA